MLSVEGLCVDFKHFSLRDISLNVGTGEYFVLVGPTGSGKTVLLETVAGLNTIKKGKIYFSGKDITSLEPEKRHISMVYQDSALFPHLSVAENITFGLRIKREKNIRINDRLAAVASMLKVKHLLSRRPAKLSGGEKQKVALARSLILDPELLLLDEPLSALDPESRENLQRELRRINQELGVTIIHVTHDCDEVQSLANRAGVMGEGRIHQIGTPEQILRKPISEFVAKFTMMRNIFPGTLKGNIFYSGTTAIIGAENKEGAEHACIRPEDVMISSEPVLSATNSFAGLITDIENKGTFVYIFVDIPPVICCQVPRHNYYQMRLCKGKNVYVSFRPDEVHVF